MNSILDNEKQSSLEIDPSLKLRLSEDSLNNSVTGEYEVKNETFNKQILKAEDEKNDNLSPKSKQGIIEKDKSDVSLKEEKNVNLEEKNDVDLKKVKSDVTLKRVNVSPSSPREKDEEKNLLNEKEKKTYLKLLLLEEELDEELSKLRTELDSAPSKQTTMNYLHEYNNIKDATQVVLGALAQMREVTIASLHKEYNLPIADE